MRGIRSRIRSRNNATRADHRSRPRDTRTPEELGGVRNAAGQDAVKVALRRRPQEAEKQLGGGHPPVPRRGPVGNQRRKVKKAKGTAGGSRGRELAANTQRPQSQWPTW